MTLFFPDINVWLALSDGGHSHHKLAQKWMSGVAESAGLIYSRFTHMGLLRLLTNPAVMAQRTLTLGQAWTVYEGWLEDSRVMFYPEPAGVHADFRQATRPVDAEHASQWVGDCYLLAFTKQCSATLVTFDRPLAAFAKKHGFKALIPAWPVSGP